MSAPSLAVRGRKDGRNAAPRARRHQRRLRGNLPQASVHALLLESAVRLG